MTLSTASRRLYALLDARRLSGLTWREVTRHMDAEGYRVTSYAAIAARVGKLNRELESRGSRDIVFALDGKFVLSSLDNADDVNRVLDRRYTMSQTTDRNAYNLEVRATS